MKGFNLIELVIVLTIIGILLAFAVPTYTEHLRHTRRLTAETALLNLASHMEGFFAEHNTYEGANFDNLKLPEFVAENQYRLVIQLATATQFKLAAIPQQVETRCGSLSLNSRGEKRSDGHGNLDECW